MKVRLVLIFLVIATVAGVIGLLFGRGGLFVTAVCTMVVSILIGIFSKLKWKTIILTTIVSVLLSLCIYAFIFGILYFQTLSFEAVIQNTDYKEHVITIEYYQWLFHYRDEIVIQPSKTLTKKLPKSLIPITPRQINIYLDGKLEKTYPLVGMGKIYIIIYNKSGNLSVSVHSIICD
jgi:hypothetical protein